MIKTTHVGSLPRPAEMITKQLKKLEITEQEMERYTLETMKRQLELSLTYINNGEVPRSDYINATIQRIGGFDGSGIAPLPKDLEELPEYSRRFSGRNGLITLNPKAPIKLPACSGELSYRGEETLRKELEVMIGAFNDLKRDDPECETELFFTAPSPGTVALFLENQFYSDYKSYLSALGEVLQQEYEIINSYGVHLQIDCPDLAMGRHTRYKELREDQFLRIADSNIETLNQSLINVSAEMSRVHICWGNYPGTHHCDIELEAILPFLSRLKPAFLSLESCNHRHAHEWQIFRQAKLPEDKIVMPGVIDTTSNTVEHPVLVADRLRNWINIFGKERVIASTDCGFASTASAASVSGEVAWLKLAALVEGARQAS